MSTLFESEQTMTTDLVEVPMHDTTPMALIERAISSGVPAEQLEKLFELNERWERNRAAESFAGAMADFQSKCPVIQKNRVAKIRGQKASFDYNFASYDDIMKQAGPALKECGLVPSFSTELEGTMIRVRCRIRHGIHFEDHTLTVPVPAMSVNDTQRYGAALSYAKRYALCAALNIVVSDEDDDGGGLGEKINDQQVATLVEWIESKGANRKKFLDYFEINTLNELPAARFDEAVSLLQRK